MARKKVKFVACDKCPADKAKPATRSEVISIGDIRWRLDLCEDCGHRLDNVMFGWGRLGEPLEERGSREASRLITADYIVEARRAAELRSKQAVQNPVAAVVKERMAVAPLAMGLPPEASEWTFTEHARERMVERQITVVEILRAACRPTTKRPGDKPSTSIYETNGIHIIVNPKTKEILTVARRSFEREAI